MADNHDPTLPPSMAWRDYPIWVLDRLAQLGFPDNGGRLALMKKANQQDYAEYSRSPEFKRILASRRDVEIFGFVLLNLPDLATDETFRVKMRTALQDPPLPEVTKPETPGHDAQFELYVAAVCHRARLLPVTLDEPDVTCVVDGATVPIAAKRIKSFDKLRTRVSGGADQIARYGRPGMIFVDVTVAHNPTNEEFIGSATEWINRLRLDSIRQDAVDKHAAELRGACRNKGVLGICFFDFLIRRQPDNRWGMEGGLNWLPTVDTDDPAALLPVLRFQEAFSAGLPYLPPD